MNRAHQKTKASFVDPVDRLLTYNDAADFVLVSVRTLARAVAEGELKIIRLGHRTVRIAPKDLQFWLAKRRGVQLETSRKTSASASQISK